MMAAMTHNSESLPTFLDVGEHTPQFLHKWDIYFNGEQQKQCTRVDTKYGYIVRIRLSKYGVPIKDGTGRFSTEKLFGRVEILPTGATYSNKEQEDGNHPKCS